MRHVARLKGVFAYSQVAVLSGVFALAQGLLSPGVAQAAGSMQFKLEGKGKNGAFVLDSATGRLDNQTNYVTIPNTGEVSVTLSWEPKDGYVPAQCTGSTQSLMSDGRVVSGNITGSGFFGNAGIALPLSATNFVLPGTLVDAGTSKRGIGISCVSASGERQEVRFRVNFDSDDTVTADCFAGSASAAGAGDAFSYYAAYPIQASYNYDATVEYWRSEFRKQFPGADNAFIEKRIRDLILPALNSKLDACTEDPMDQILQPQPHCVQKCEAYNPSRTNKQADGSYSVCANAGGSRGAFGLQLSTKITDAGGKALEPTAQTGQPYTVNVSRGQATSSGDAYTSIRIGTSNANEDNQHGLAVGKSVVYSDSNMRDLNNLDGTANANYKRTEGAGVSVRSGSNCRSINQRVFTDSGSVQNETYSYFIQQYARSGQGTGQFWPKTPNALYQIAQVEPVTTSISVLGAAAGSDYSISGSGTASSVTFNKPGTYVISVKQSDFSAALVFCQKGAPDPRAYQTRPYNCGSGARRVQQYKGHEFPAMVMNYSVTVTGEPQLDFTVNGVTANAGAPDVTTTSSYPAGASADPLSASLAASWSSSSLPSGTACSVTSDVSRANGVTLTSSPWKDAPQGGLPTSNASAPVAVGNILRGADSAIKLTLVCGTLSRSVTVKVARENGSGSTGLGFTFTDLRGRSYSVNSSNPLTVTLDEFPIGTPMNFTTQWVGGDDIVSCVASPAGITNGATVASPLWSAGGATAKNGSSPLSVNGADAPGATTSLTLNMSCATTAGGTENRTVVAAIRREAVSEFKISGMVMYENGTPVPDREISLNGIALMTTLPNGSYEISVPASGGTFDVAVVPGARETCIAPASCVNTVTVSGANVGNVDFILKSPPGSGGSTLNFGTGSRQWSK